MKRKMRIKQFMKIYEDYVSYIWKCAHNFHRDKKHVLDSIYTSSDIFQLMCYEIWKYAYKYEKNKGATLKTYIITAIKRVMYRALYNSGLKKSQVNNVVLSMDYTLKTSYLDDMPFTLHDCISDVKFDFETKFMLEFYGKKLSAREWHIYIMVWHGYTYAEIGKYFKLSRQRIGQIINVIRKKIKKLMEIYEPEKLSKKNRSGKALRRVKDRKYHFKRR